MAIFNFGLVYSEANLGLSGHSGTWQPWHTHARTHDKNPDGGDSCAYIHHPLLSILLWKGRERDSVLLLCVHQPKIGIGQGGMGREERVPKMGRILQIFMFDWWTRMACCCCSQMSHSFLSSQLIFIANIRWVCLLCLLIFFNPNFFFPSPVIGYQCNQFLTRDEWRSRRRICVWKEPGMMERGGGISISFHAYTHQSILVEEKLVWKKIENMLQNRIFSPSRNYGLSSAIDVIRSAELRGQKKNRPEMTLQHFWGGGGGREGGGVWLIATGSSVLGEGGFQLLFPTTSLNGSEDETCWYHWRRGEGGEALDSSQTIIFGKNFFSRKTGFSIMARKRDYDCLITVHIIHEPRPFFISCVQPIILVSQPSSSSSFFPLSFGNARAEKTPLLSDNQAAVHFYIWMESRVARLVHFIVHFESFAGFFIGDFFKVVIRGW